MDWDSTLPLAQLQLGSLRTPKKYVVANAVRFQNDVQKHGGRGVITMRQKTIYYLLSGVFGFENVQSSIHFGDYETYSIFQKPHHIYFHLRQMSCPKTTISLGTIHEQVEVQKR